MYFNLDIMEYYLNKHISKVCLLFTREMKITRKVIKHLEMVMIERMERLRNQQKIFGPLILW